MVQTLNRKKKITYRGGRLKYQEKEIIGPEVLGRGMRVQRRRDAGRSHDGNSQTSGALPKGNVTGQPKQKEEERGIEEKGAPKMGRLL